jgi:hypothetical protein
MNQNVVTGRLQIPIGNFKSDLIFVKQYVQLTAEPQLKKQLWDEKIEFWAIEFACTREQWQTLEPKLKEMGIESNLYAMPDLYFKAQEEQQRELARIGEKNKLWLVWTIGIGLFFAGWITIMLDGGWLLGLGLIGVGILVEAVGLTKLDLWHEKRAQSKK